MKTDPKNQSHESSAQEQTQGGMSHELLMASVAHDYNNTLAVIQSNLQLLQTSENVQSALGEDEREMLETALMACQSGAELTRRLIAYIGVGKEEKSDLKIRDIVVECVRMCRKGFEGGGQTPEILVGPSVLSSEAYVHMGYSAFSNTVMNLVKNAVEATLEKGTLDPVRIHMDLVEENRANWCHLYIADRGPGIREEDLEQVFTPHFSTKSKKHLGTGLGLAGARNLVREAGGEIHALSTPGEGTTMTITLPVCKAAVEPAKEEVEEDSKESVKSAIILDSEQPRALRPVTPVDISEEASRIEDHSQQQRNVIYVVDDEKMVGIAVSRMVSRLKKGKADVMYLPSGEELILKMSEDPELPSWIFIDYSMPGMNGIETLRKVIDLIGEENATKVGMVILSGMEVEEKRELMSKFSHIRFFSKPFSLEVMQKLFETHDGDKLSLKTTASMKLPPIAKPKKTVISAINP